MPETLVYTVVAVGVKFVVGLTMALVLDQERRWNNVFQTLLFVPWAVPVVIVSLNWRWIYDDCAYGDLTGALGYRSP